MESESVQNTVDPAGAMAQAMARICELATEDMSRAMAVLSDADLDHLYEIRPTERPINDLLTATESVLSTSRITVDAMRQFDARAESSPRLYTVLAPFMSVVIYPDLSPEHLAQRYHSAAVDALFAWVDAVYSIASVLHGS
jgi:hypothetical protein